MRKVYEMRALRNKKEFAISKEDQIIVQREVKLLLQRYKKIHKYRCLKANTVNLDQPSEQKLGNKDEEDFDSYNKQDQKK